MIDITWINIFVFLIAVGGVLSSINQVRIISRLEAIEREKGDKEAAP